MINNDPSPVLNTAQVAERWNIPAYTIRRWCYRGAFPGAFRVGHRWVIPRDVVLAREQGRRIDQNELNTA